jgi:hypothetical protein
LSSEPQNWPTPDTRPDAPNTGANKKSSPAGLEANALAAMRGWHTPKANDAEKRGNVSADKRNGLLGEANHWQTPNASGFSSRGGRQKGQQLLDGQVKRWPTPRAEDSEQVGNHTSPGSHAGDSLGATAKAFPTPAAADGDREGNYPRGNQTLPGLAKHWNTPQAADSEAAGSLKRGSSLNADLQTWATPQSHDGRRPGADTKSNQEANLNKQAALFETPTTRDGEGAAKEENSLRGLPTATTEKLGSASSGDGRKLNPLFDEWLINWPIGWTCPHKPKAAPTASGITDFARWETASIRSLQAWLSAYWQSGLESASSSASHRADKL